MTRIALTDGSGRWFDAEKATHWDEGTRWDGSNHISLATGSQWDHEALYQTAGGFWILHSYSQWQGVADAYRAITPREAAAWLICNEHDLAEGLCPEAEGLEV